MCNVCNTGYNVTRSSCRSATCSGSGLYGSLFNGLNTSTNSVATSGGYNSCGTYQTVCRDCNGCLRIQNHSCGCCNHCCLHNKVLYKLNQKYPNHDYIIVDQFTTPRSYYAYLKEAPAIQRGITFITKAEDQCLSVAAASLISRFVFLKEMDKITKELGFETPKGAGEKVDEIGKRILDEKGLDYLKNITKNNFKNLEKIINM